MQLALLAALAVPLGLTADQLAARRQTESVAQIAAERGVDVGLLRSRALAAVDPLLDEAVARHVLRDDERRALRWRVRHSLAL
jgi:hypothetical protein